MEMVNMNVLIPYPGFLNFEVMQVRNKYLKINHISYLNLSHRVDYFQKYQ